MPTSHCQAPAFVTDLKDNDVLLGRGRVNYKFIGNKRFRALVRTLKKEYTRVRRNQTKNRIARSIVDEIQLRRRGRFLQRIDTPQEALAYCVPKGLKQSAWKIVEAAVALEKCKQTLRDCNKGSKLTDIARQVPKSSTTLGEKNNTRDSLLDTVSGKKARIKSKNPVQSSKQGKEATLGTQQGRLSTVPKMTMPHETDTIPPNNGAPMTSELGAVPGPFSAEVVEKGEELRNLVLHRARIQLLDQKYQQLQNQHRHLLFRAFETRLLQREQLLYNASLFSGQTTSPQVPESSLQQILNQARISCSPWQASRAVDDLRYGMTSQASFPMGHVETFPTELSSSYHEDICRLLFLRRQTFYNDGGR